MTSFIVSRVAHDRKSITGSGAQNVEFRITSTFDCKWLAKASVVWTVVDEGGRGASKSALSCTSWKIQQFSWPFMAGDGEGRNSHLIFLEMGDRTAQGHHIFSEIGEPSYTKF